jgi:hypothetical protein
VEGVDGRAKLGNRLGLPVEVATAHVFRRRQQHRRLGLWGAAVNASGVVRVEVAGRVQGMTGRAHRDEDTQTNETNFASKLFFFSW